MVLVESRKWRRQRAACEHEWPSDDEVKALATSGQAMGSRHVLVYCRRCDASMVVVAQSLPGVEGDERDDL